jgi:hypothetical protein
VKRFAAAVIALLAAFGLAAPLASAPADPTIVAAGDIACDVLPNAPKEEVDDRSGPTDCRMVQTADLIARLHPAAVLPLGDEQYADGAYAAFQSSYGPTWGRFDAIAHPVPGNHEYLTLGADGYFRYFGERAGERGRGYYSYDIGAWHFVAINANCGHAAGCGPGSPQERWLASDLASHKSACTLAYWHQPRFSSGNHHSDANYQPFWEDLYAARADIVLNGHDHDYERFDPQTPSGAADAARGIREFVVGTGGKSHYTFRQTEASSVVRNNTDFGVLALTLHPHGYDWRFVPVRVGGFSDSGSGRCHGR